MSAFNTQQGTASEFLLLGQSAKDLGPSVHLLLHSTKQNLLVIFFSRTKSEGECVKLQTCFFLLEVAVLNNHG